MAQSVFRSSLILGLLSTVRPLSIDMYLPAMSAMGADLGTDVAATQATLTAFFLAFGLAQLAYGPLADQVGRKPPILIGVTIFILGAVGCSLTARPCRW